MSGFREGDRVYHTQLQMFGTYLGRHDWGTTPPEVTSYVSFDNDPHYHGEARPVSTDRLVPAEDVL